MPDQILDSLARWLLERYKTVAERRASLLRMWLHRAGPADTRELNEIVRRVKGGEYSAVLAETIEAQAGRFAEAGKADRFINDLKRRVNDEWERRKTS